MAKSGATAAAEATVSADAAMMPPDAVDDLVERWWGDHFPGSEVARVTAAWNAAFAAKEDLKARLKGALVAFQ